MIVPVAKLFTEDDSRIALEVSEFSDCVSPESRSPVDMPGEPSAGEAVLPLGKPMSKRKLSLSGRERNFSIRIKSGGYSPLLMRQPTPEPCPSPLLMNKRHSRSVTNISAPMSSSVNLTSSINCQDGISSDEEETEFAAQARKTIDWVDEQTVSPVGEKRASGPIVPTLQKAKMQEDDDMYENKTALATPENEIDFSKEASAGPLSSTTSPTSDNCSSLLLQEQEYDSGTESEDVRSTTPPLPGESDFKLPTVLPSGDVLESPPLPKEEDSFSSEFFPVKSLPPVQDTSFKRPNQDTLASAKKMGIPIGEPPSGIPVGEPRGKPLKRGLPVGGIPLQFATAQSFSGTSEGWGPGNHTSRDCGVVRKRKGTAPSGSLSARNVLRSASPAKESKKAESSTVEGSPSTSLAPGDLSISCRHFPAHVSPGVRRANRTGSFRLATIEHEEKGVESKRRFIGQRNQGDEPPLHFKSDESV